MGSASAFQPARLVVGVLSSPSSAFCSLLESELERRFGPAEAVGADLEFAWSGYYDEEMGGRPRRSFLSFAELVDPGELAAIKAFTNSLERAYMVGGRRGFNLDPGLLSLSRFVLATTKDRPQRIALSGGIYADLTLVYERGDYRPLPWTYPDWASEEYRGRLRMLRRGLKAELHSPGPVEREPGA
jgi:hypothetical protein